MPVVELPQGDVSYQVFGPEAPTAPPVVFVHGLLVNGELWTAVAEQLATTGVRSYLLDLPLGAHRTALDPEADLTPRGVARLILDLLEALELTDVTLVGNDTGGALCQFVVDTDPTRIGRLVLTNCDAFDQFPPRPFGLLVAAGRSRTALRLMGASVRPTMLRHSVLGYGALARDLDAEMTRRWMTPLRTDAAIRRDTARFMRGIDKRDLLDASTRLPRFTKPVRLVWGTADRFFRLEFAHRLAAAFPNAVVVEVPDARTFVPLDEPHRVAAEITAALDQRPR